ncbi:MAG: DUF3602 domain-containing protein [Candidatus Gracilibacteria bacterium]
MQRLTADRRLREAAKTIEEDGVPSGRIPVARDRRLKSTTANFRAGRGGRGNAKAKNSKQVTKKTKVFRGKFKGGSYTIGRRK